MRREMTADRRRFNKNRHRWNRVRYRKILLGRLYGRDGQLARG